MSGFGGNGACSRHIHVLGAALGCLALANCSGGGLSGKIDPKYGTSASTRVVEPGEPVPKGGGKYRVGKPYTIAGREYVPQEDMNYTATGMASWYGDDFHGRYTANGEIFDMNSITAAHTTLPLPSYVRVTNLSNHKSLVVRVNDRGPYVGDRVIDLSVRSAKLLGFYGHGLAKVKVDYVGRAPLAGSDDAKLASTLREGGPRLAAVAPVQVAAAGSFAPAYFDARPMKEVAARAPSPPERPYRLGEGAREVPAVRQTASRTPTIELAASARPHPAENAVRKPAIAAEPAVSPVSAYAPTRYDAPAGFMSGRGLY
ncbi:MAG: septal ring lytic transglycosylase RlpA family protein [Pseudolabrys sp.]